MFYRITADLVLAVHTSFVIFVILGLALILIGGARGWPWVKNPWFRLGHLVAIGVVVAQAWLGAICPLTTLEMALRSRADDAVYSGSFIAHWMEALLYYEASLWVFAICYTVFGSLVVASWVIVRPWPLARRGQPVPGEHALDADDQVLMAVNSDRVPPTLRIPSAHAPCVGTCR